MEVITIDFETFWTTEYSLSKMTPMGYIKDPRFEVISCAIKRGEQPTKVVWQQDEVGEELRKIDWSRAACVAHNGNEFDFMILAWIYDCHPKLFVDTLALSRPFHQSEVGGSLKSLSAAYGLPKKDNEILLQTRGKRYIDLTLDEMVRMAEYNRTDVDNTYALFNIFRKKTPKKELLLSDMSARMTCYPQFVCDTELLDKTLLSAEAEQTAQLAALCTTLDVFTVEEVRKELASSQKFAQALKSFGVEPPVKISKTTGKPALALAKTDEEFIALAEHPDERVANLVSARLGVKSTLLQTRLQRMSEIAKVMGGKMPVPLAYHAATTGRWGGRVWNPQNLPRIDPKRPKASDALRKALRAPPGYKVVVSDLSGIELRVNHYLWDVPSTKEMYLADPKADLYLSFAATLYGKPESEVTEAERQLAKVAQLGLGFGAGAATFQKVAKLMGGIELDLDEARRVTEAWRRKYDEIVKGWDRCNTLIQALFNNAHMSPDPRGLVYSDGGSVMLPSGRRLYYPELTARTDDEGKRQFVYGVGSKQSKIYGGRFVENAVQAIARDILAEQALAIWQTTERWPALTVHDELVYVVPEDDAEQHLRTINAVMRTPPQWLPGIVLWSKGDIADTYGEAK